MVAQFPSAYNTFVKSHDASNKLTVNFSRNIKDFAVNSYVQIQPVKKPAGYYREVTVEEAGRLLNSDLADFAWADGQEAPPDWDGTESSQYKEFRTRRYKFGATVGDMTVEHADYDLEDEHAAIKAQQAMTARTQLVCTALTTTGNYGTGHYSTVSGISGNTGNWAASTTARQDIKRSLNYAANVILKDTLAAVNINDLVLVMSPGCAMAISQSQELVDHIKGSPEALAQIRGELPGQNAIFGLPDKLYGFPIIVEKTAKTTSRKGATRAVSYVLGDTTPFMVSRPGGLVGKFGAPSFSTCVLFMLEEMTQEKLHDTNNRLTRIRVVENYDVKLVAPVSGYLFTSAV